MYNWREKMEKDTGRERRERERESPGSSDALMWHRASTLRVQANERFPDERLT